MPRDGGGVYSPPAGTTATAGTPIESAKYNALVADLTNTLNAPIPILQGGTGQSTAGAALTALGGLSATTSLTALGVLTPAADRLPYFTGASTAALATFTAAGRALVDDADAAAQRATLGLVIGTNVQAYDAALASLAGLSLVAGDIIYATGADTFVRLAKGTAAQVLAMNAGATAPEWVTPASGAPSTADVLNATAGATLGDVGTYAFLSRATGGATTTAGTTYAGSDLRYDGIRTPSSSGNVTHPATVGATPSGTWRAMGTMVGTAGTFSATLFLRTV